MLGSFYIGLYWLRQTFGTRLLENEVDIKLISESMRRNIPTMILNR